MKTFQEIRKSYSYSQINYQEFLEIINFIRDGGYVLNNYKKWNRLYIDETGILRINNFRNKTKTLMNIGTIIDNSNYKVKLKNGKILGFVDDFFYLIN